MGKPYSMDLRERVVAAIEGGESTHRTATRFSIGIATAGAWARLEDPAPFGSLLERYRGLAM